MNTWQLPEVPEHADGFAITRTTDPITWHGQDYENVGAPGGASSVRKALATAHRLQTVAELNRSGFAPYAVLDVVGDEGNPIEGLTFSIPTHQAFLWWASQMPLKPVEGSWEEQAASVLPEDPRVELLLTPEAATLMADLVCEGVLLSEMPLAEAQRLLAAQVIDALRRLTGYAENDSAHASSVR